ncbi:MAG TPA: hypothetical protein VNC60_01425 [Actinomycetota bacterium]|nr:hypothetical protein [Actinomycetota bacterium]
MSDLLDQTSPADDAAGESTARRLAGFGLTALGGLLVGVGALLPWIRSSVRGLPDELSPTYYGIDLPDGLVVLAGAAVMLGGLAITRLAASPRTRRIGACAIVGAAFVTLVVAAVTTATAESRFEPAAVDEILAALDPSGTATAAQRSQIEASAETRLAAGSSVTMAGALLGMAGGLLVLSWAARGSVAPGADGTPVTTSDPER